MQCNCWLYSRNPISPDRLYKVLAMAIWPTDDSAALKEAEAARKIAVRFLVAVQPVDLPQLQDVLAKIMGPATAQPGALIKLLAIYQEAGKRNSILPPPNIGQPPKMAPQTAPSASTPRSSKPPPIKPKSSPPEDESRRAPRPSEACRSCDGKGYRIKVDKENVMKETKVVCSKCGGNGREPPPSTGKGRGRGRRGPYVEETEEEEDINRKGDNFLRRHGFDKWGD